MASTPQKAKNVDAALVCSPCIGGSPESLVPPNQQAVHKENCHNCGVLFPITKLGAWSKGFKTCPLCKNLYNRFMDSGPGLTNPAARNYMKSLSGERRHKCFLTMAKENDRLNNIIYLTINFPSHACRASLPRICHDRLSSICPLLVTSVLHVSLYIRPTSLAISTVSYPNHVPRDNLPIFFSMCYVHTFSLRSSHSTQSHFYSCCDSFSPALFYLVAVPYFVV